MANRTNDFTNRPTYRVVPLVRQYALSSIPQYSTPNPFVDGMAPRPISKTRGQKRSSTSISSAQDTILRYSTPKRPRGMHLTPKALMAFQGSVARLTPPGFTPLVAAIRSGAVPTAPRGEGTIPALNFSYSALQGDTDIEDDADTDSIQSSPIQGSRPFGHSGALVRRSTDASLVEGIEAGKLSVITEGNEGQGQEQTEPEGDETGEEFEEGELLEDPHNPFSRPFGAVAECRGFATPSFPTPAILWGEGLTSPLGTRFTFYDSYRLSEPFTPAGTSSSFQFTREPLTPYVYRMANIYRFIPGISSKRSVFMTLLHVFSWATGGEGISIHDFGRIFAQCTICDAYIYTEKQEVHKCDRDTAPPGLTNGRGFVPGAVLRWLQEDDGGLTKKDLDTIFSLCSGCHHVMLAILGEDHSFICTARKTGLPAAVADQ